MAKSANQDGMAQMEELINQSKNGYHLLFDNNDIARVFATGKNESLLQVNNLKKVQDLLSEFMSKKSFNDKQFYLRSLDKESYDLIVRTYFNILENNILSTQKKH